ELPAPRDAAEKYRQPPAFGAEVEHELGHVVEQSAKVRRVAPVRRVQPGAATVQKEHLEAGFGEHAARASVPPTVAADAVDEHEPRAGRPAGGIVAEVEAITIGSEEGGETHAPGPAHFRERGG